MSVSEWYVRRGRVSRQEWWLQYVLPILLVVVLARWADGVLGLTEIEAFVGDSTGPLDQLVDVLVLVPTVSASVGRLHDQGDSAWRLLLLLVPIVGAVLLIVFVFLIRGGRLPNRYGPAPAPMGWPRLRRTRGRSEPGSETAPQLQAQGR